MISHETEHGIWYQRKIQKLINLLKRMKIESPQGQQWSIDENFDKLHEIKL
jgi:hypothetical protein